MTNTLVNFGNFFNYIILSPLPLSAQEKISSENTVWRNAQFPSAWGIMMKTWGSILLGGMSKIELCSSLNTINLKLFGNHGGI